MIWSFNPNDLYTAGIAVVAAVPAFRKFVPALRKAEPVVEAVVKDTVQMAKDAARLPVVAELEARVKAQGKQLEAHTRESNLYRVVAATVHELGVDMSKASPEAKSMAAVAASTFARQTLGMNVTTDEILTTIDDIQRFATSVSAHPAVQAVKQLAAAQSTTSVSAAPNVTANDSSPAMTPGMPSATSEPSAAPASAIPGPPADLVPPVPAQ